MKQNTRAIILKMVKANPHVSMRALLDAVGMSNSWNVLYHLNRLEADGLIHWKGERKPKSGWQIQSESRFKSSDQGMRKMSKSELAQRIDAVVAKALRAPRSAPSDDVVQISKTPLFRNGTLRASRLG
jgi:predicted ArsR family transcriptional regulator